MRPALQTELTRNVCPSNGDPAINRSKIAPPSNGHLPQESPDEQRTAMGTCLRIAWQATDGKWALTPKLLDEWWTAMGTCPGIAWLATDGNGRLPWDCLTGDGRQSAPAPKLPDEWQMAMGTCPEIAWLATDGNGHLPRNCLMRDGRQLAPAPKLPDEWRMAMGTCLEIAWQVADASPWNCRKNDGREVCDDRPRGDDLDVAVGTVGNPESPELCNRAIHTRAVHLTATGHHLGGCGDRASGKVLHPYKIGVQTPQTEPHVGEIDTRTERVWLGNGRDVPQPNRKERRGKSHAKTEKRKNKIIFFSRRGRGCVRKSRTRVTAWVRSGDWTGHSLLPSARYAREGGQIDPNQRESCDTSGRESSGVCATNSNCALRIIDNNMSDSQYKQRIGTLFPNETTAFELKVKAKHFHNMILILNYVHVADTKKLLSFRKALNNDPVQYFKFAQASHRLYGIVSVVVRGKLLDVQY